jgi:hypothetical protein
MQNRIKFKKVHKCTKTAKTTILYILSWMITTLGYNRKTDLQKLSESQKIGF